MKPCGYCGYALQNGAEICGNCSRTCKQSVCVNPRLKPKQGFPRYSIWSDLVLTLALAGAGFYFFGVLGGLAGFGLGVILAIGI